METMYCENDSVFGNCGYSTIDIEDESGVAQWRLSIETRVWGKSLYTTAEISEWIGENKLKHEHEDFRQHLIINHNPPHKMEFVKEQHESAIELVKSIAIAARRHYETSEKTRGKYASLLAGLRVIEQVN